MKISTKNSIQFKIKNFILILTMILMTSIFTIEAKGETLPPNINAEGVVLLDGNTGKVLYGKNEDQSLAPASTTKILTALIVLEKTNLNDIVTVGKNPPNAEGTSIGLKEGDQYTIEEILHGLLLESANDCAEALAEYVGGSIENFAKIMNDKARSLGAINCNFVNPSGLYEDDHKTTAHDLALIMREVYKNPDFIRISREPIFKFPPSKVDGLEKWVNNKNMLIRTSNSYYYPCAICGKTGYTTNSQHTYTAVAERNGQILVLSILKCPDKDTYFKGSKDLFEYGFNNFKSLKLYSKGDEISTYKINKNLEMPLIASQDFYYTIKNEDLKKFLNKDLKDVSNEEIISTLNPKVELENVNLKNKSFNRGDKILNGSVKINDEVIGTLSLTAPIDREYSKLETSYSFSSIPLIVIIIAVIAVISILILIISKYSSHKKIKKFNNRFFN